MYKYGIVNNEALLHCDAATTPQDVSNLVLESSSVSYTHLTLPTKA